jgi:hypothetical protein
MHPNPSPSPGGRTATDVEAFGPIATAPIAALPEGVGEAAPAPRPLMLRGDQPKAAVLLVEIDVQGLVEA